MPGVELLLIGCPLVLLLLCDLLHDKSSVLLLLHVQVPLVVDPVLDVFIELIVLEIVLKSFGQLVVAVVMHELISDDLGLGLELLEKLFGLCLLSHGIFQETVLMIHQRRQRGFLGAEGGHIGAITVRASSQGLHFAAYQRLAW